MSKKSQDQHRARYTLEFKLEAVRLVKAGQEASVTARVLGIPKQTLSNWVRLPFSSSPVEIGSSIEPSTLGEWRGPSGAMPAPAESSIRVVMRSSPPWSTMPRFSLEANCSEPAVWARRLSAADCKRAVGRCWACSHRGAGNAH